MLMILPHQKMNYKKSEKRVKEKNIAVCPQINKKGINIMIVHR